MSEATEEHLRVRYIALRDAAVVLLDALDGDAAVPEQSKSGHSREAMVVRALLRWEPE